MNLPIPPTLRSLALALAVGALSGPLARAHPYASGISNNAGTISFILNETADTVGVYFPDNGSTNFLGANLAPGVHSFTLGPGTNRYVITVNKVGSGAVTQLSNDTNRFNLFYGPRGVAVNQNPKTGNFGRTYVVNANTGTSTSGTTQRTLTWGVYAVNPDGSDAVGQGDTASTCNMTRVPTSVTTTYSPFKISVGSDDMVYVADGCGEYYGGNTNGVYMVTPDLSFGTNLFPILHSDPEVGGGVVGTPVTFGSYADGTLGLYTVFVGPGRSHPGLSDHLAVHQFHRTSFYQRSRGDLQCRNWLGPGRVGRYDYRPGREDLSPSSIGQRPPAATCRSMSSPLTARRNCGTRGTIGRRLAAILSATIAASRFPMTGS